MSSRDTTVRVVVIDDDWQTKVFAASAYPGEGVAIASLVRAITGVAISIESAYARAEEVTLSGAVTPPVDDWEVTVRAAGAEVTAGVVVPDFVSSAFWGRPSPISWPYDELGVPAGVALCPVPASDCVTLQGPRPRNVGLWVRADFRNSPESSPLPAPARCVEIFVLSFWPEDAIGDLVGARSGLARFWNVIVLDNRIETENLREATHVHARSNRALDSSVAEIHLFDSFRGDNAAAPDPRTQVIVEATRVNLVLPPGLRQVRFPHFSLLKDMEEKRYKRCVGDLSQPLPAEEADVVHAARMAFQRSARWQAPIFHLFQAMVPHSAAGAAEHGFPLLLQGASPRLASLFAHVLHDLGPHWSRRIIELSCATLPRDVADAHASVFGRATPGRDELHPGALQPAFGGTLFLSDLDCLPEALWPAVAQLLATRTYRPEGATAAETADVVVVASARAEEKPFAELLTKVQVTPLHALVPETIADAVRLCFQWVKEALTTPPLGPAPIWPPMPHVHPVRDPTQAARMRNTLLPPSEIDAFASMVRADKLSIDALCILLRDRILGLAPPPAGPLAQQGHSTVHTAGANPAPPPSLEQRRRAVYEAARLVREHEDAKGVEGLAAVSRALVEYWEGADPAQNQAPGGLGAWIDAGAPGFASNRQPLFPSETSQPLAERKTEIVVVAAFLAWARRQEVTNASKRNANLARVIGGGNPLEDIRDIVNKWLPEKRPKLTDSTPVWGRIVAGTGILVGETLRLKKKDDVTEIPLAPPMAAWWSLVFDIYARLGEEPNPPLTPPTARSPSAARSPEAQNRNG